KFNTTRVINDKYTEWKNENSKKVGLIDKPIPHLIEMGFEEKKTKINGRDVMLLRIETDKFNKLIERYCKFAPAEDAEDDDDFDYCGNNPQFEKQFPFPA
ncbi:MAG: hypothetical protein PHQ74_15270, partial [Crocinitomicaceae bacterium]|nr:hypothetical protein [Crocinitomicaceae bacterium]